MERNLVARGMLIALAFCFVGCIVDEVEPGPNVHQFGYATFNGRGVISPSSDSDVWMMTAKPEALGQFAVNVALEPNAQVAVQVGTNLISLHCPGAATSNCTYGPAQDARLSFATTTTASVQLTFTTTSSAPSLSYGFKIENTPLCGNGYVETAEECDDGNPTSGDGCDGTCLVEWPSECVSVPPETYPANYASDEVFQTMLTRAKTAGYPTEVFASARCTFDEFEMYVGVLRRLGAAPAPMLLMSRSDAPIPFNHTVLDVQANSLWFGPGPNAISMIPPPGGGLELLGPIGDLDCTSPFDPNGKSCTEAWRAWSCCFLNASVSDPLCTAGCVASAASGYAATCIGLGPWALLPCGAGAVGIGGGCINWCGGCQFPYNAPCCSGGCQEGLCKILSIAPLGLFTCSDTVPPSPCACQGTCRACVLGGEGCQDLDRNALNSDVIVASKLARAEIIWDLCVCSASCPGTECPLGLERESQGAAVVNMNLYNCAGWQSGNCHGSVNCQICDPTCSLCQNGVQLDMAWDNAAADSNPPGVCGGSDGVVAQQRAAPVVEEWKLRAPIEDLQACCDPPLNESPF